MARTINLELAHNIFRNLTVSANGGYFNNEYPGVTLREYGYTAGAKLEYKITRSIAIRASYSHERRAVIRRATITPPMSISSA